MRLGLIARADDTGLGVQTHEFYKHMDVAKTMVIDLSDFNQNEQHFDRYPDATIVKGFPTPTDFSNFLKGLDIIFTCEIPYGYNLFEMAEFMGVKTVLQYNYEFLDYLQSPQLPKPSLFVAPTLWHYDEVAYDNKAVLPVPIATEHFNNREDCICQEEKKTATTTYLPTSGQYGSTGAKTLVSAKSVDKKQKDQKYTTPSMRGQQSTTLGSVAESASSYQTTCYLHKVTADTFLHIVGKPAVHDRNGTSDLLKALQFVTVPIKVIIKCQQKAYVEFLSSGFAIPENVELVIDTKTEDNYWDNYKEGDVLVMPRRYGGLCLPVNEALGAGMPVIMPAIDPNDTWLNTDWLVPATKTGEFMARTTIDIFTTDAEALAKKITQFATDRSFYSRAKHLAYNYKHRQSWATLKPVYETVFDELITKGHVSL